MKNYQLALAIGGVAVAWVGLVLWAPIMVATALPAPVSLAFFVAHWLVN